MDIAGAGTGIYLPLYRLSAWSWSGAFGIQYKSEILVSPKNSDLSALICNLILGLHEIKLS